MTIGTTNVFSDLATNQWIRQLNLTLLASSLTHSGTFSHLVIKLHISHARMSQTQKQNSGKKIQLTYTQTIYIYIYTHTIVKSGYENLRIPFK